MKRAGSCIKDIFYRGVHKYTTCCHGKRWSEGADFPTACEECLSALDTIREIQSNHKEKI